MQTPTNIDDILVPREQAMLKNEQIPAQPANVALEQPQEPHLEAISTENLQNEPENSLNNENKAEDVGNSTQEDNVSSSTQETAHETKEKLIDEYGNPVEKPRMYTEEELQQRIRDRLSRGRNAEQPTPQQTQQAAKEFAPDPNSEESWETQLEAFVEKTIEKKQKKAAQEQWQHQEKQKQADFETKFNAGMSKYQDFSQVVAGKSITNGIMLAARALDNPAAFIYGASKLHPQELDRIARIDDPYAQAAEVGRLHERMVKARNTNSKAAKPLDTPKADIPTKAVNRPNIDNLIEQHGRELHNKRNPGRR